MITEGIYLMDVFQSLPPLPISEFVAAILGGGITFYATVYSERRQREKKTTRLRRALISEIDSIEVREIHAAAQTLQTGDDSVGIIEDVQDELFGDIDNPMIQNMLPNPDDLKRLAVSEVGEQLTKTNLSTPIFDSNAGQIGNLTPDQINQVIVFYRTLSQMKETLNKAAQSEIREERMELEERISDGDMGHEYYVDRLEELSEKLAEDKKDTLEALNAEEFIEIEDSYKATPQSDD